MGEMQCKMHCKVQCNLQGVQKVGLCTVFNLFIIMKNVLELMLYTKVFRVCFVFRRVSCGHRVYRHHETGITCSVNTYVFPTVRRCRICIVPIRPMLLCMCARLNLTERIGCFGQTPGEANSRGNLKLKIKADKRKS